MASLTNAAAHRAARNAASNALADTGAGVASIQLYDAQSGGASARDLCEADIAACEAAA